MQQPHKNIPMEWLRTLVTVIDTGGFSQAGELLSRTQPAISRQIKELEERLGRQLLLRSGRTLNVTESGLRVYDQAKRILALNDELLLEFSGNSVTGKLHLGIPSEFASVLLPRIIGSFSQNYPDVSLEVTSDLSRNLLAKGKRDQFDLILALQEDSQTFDENIVLKDDLVWVASPKFSAHLLKPLPLVLAPDGCMYRKRAETVLQSADIPWRNVFTIPDLNGIQSALEAGLGITALTRSTVPESLRILRPSGSLPKLGEIGIGLHFKSNRPSPAAMRLAEHLQSGLLAN
ncbi:LysR family transcriptional regulator [Microbulbifer agarilyticus]|uniref:LysR family transcriptional regulator n=1 Tax=Microbulbifer agarilyticus TaxID=260552 RepID=UPI001CD30AB7|nr:LysR family transcriptional regulator [Microbulbifer agarilyticus]MCA0892058.1 LysR family transcriptional regulator [Microbulbifer agarilyticus]